MSRHAWTPAAFAEGAECSRCGLLAVFEDDDDTLCGKPATREITVRYEPEHRCPHRVYVEGVPCAAFPAFAWARRYAKRLNGGKLPRINTPEYAAIFPDRVVVIPTGTGFAVVNRWCVRDRHITHEEAMTAAHELAQRVQR